jgi:hypothetical protein
MLLMLSLVAAVVTRGASRNWWRGEVSPGLLLVGHGCGKDAQRRGREVRKWISYACIGEANSLAT